MEEIPAHSLAAPNGYATEIRPAVPEAALTVISSNIREIKPETYYGEQDIDYGTTPFYGWTAHFPPPCVDGYKEFDISGSPASGELARVCVLSNPTTTQQKIQIDAMQQCLQNPEPESYQCKVFHKIMNETDREETKSAIKCLSSNDANSEACKNFQELLPSQMI